MSWTWLLFAAVGAVFVTAVIISIIEWWDKPPMEEEQAKLEVMRRIVEARRRNE